MNILDTFLILFESDADEVEKGAEKAEKSTDKLDKKLKQTDDSSERLGRSFLEMVGYATQAITAVLSIGAITASVFAAADYADYLDKASESLGVNIEQLDLWGRAAQVAGGSTDGLIGSVKALNAGMAQMDVTGKSRLKPFFDEIGVAMTTASGKARDAFEIFPEIADAFEKMSKQQSLGFGRKLGLDDGTIMLLQKGRREVDALIKRQKELGTINQEDAKVAAEYKDSLDNLGFAWRAFASIIAGDVLPPLTFLVEKFTGFVLWMQQHKGFIYGFLTGMAGIITFLAIRTGLLAAAVAFLVSPFFLVLAAIAAVGVGLGLLWDDFQKWMENPNLSYLNKLWEILTTPVIAPAWNAFKNLLEGIANYIDESVQGILRMIDAIGDFFSFGDKAYAKARHALSFAGSTPINSASTTSITGPQSSNKSVSIGEINIKTQATDADGIANDIGRSMSSQYNQVISNYDDGIRK